MGTTRWLDEAFYGSFSLSLGCCHRLHRYTMQTAISAHAYPEQTRGLKLLLASAPEVLLLQTPQCGPQGHPVFRHKNGARSSY